MTKFDEIVSGMKGKLELTSRDKITGEVLDHEVDDNVFLQVGMAAMLRAITVPAPAGGQLEHILQTFSIGNDIGSGTLLVPEPAVSTYTAANQNIVYSAEHADLTINYPNYYTTEVVLVLDGDAVMAQYPGEVDLRFSSAAMYTGGGVPFCYRRFQTRTITREIVIDVKWTLYFDGQGGI